MVCSRTRELLIRLLERAAYPSSIISHTSRTPFEQARAIYNHVRARGVSSQLALYANAGDHMIEEYVRNCWLGLAPSVPKTSPVGIQFFAHVSRTCCAAPESAWHQPAKDAVASAAKAQGHQATIQRAGKG